MSANNRKKEEKRKEKNIYRTFFCSQYDTIAFCKPEYYLAMYF